MAKLERLKETNFTTNDRTTLYIDNEGVEGLRKNMLASVERLVLDTSAFDMEDEINGTECVQELINQWHKVAETTDNYRNFYINHVDPTIIRAIKSVNDTAQEIADALDGDSLHTNKNRFINNRDTSRTNKIIIEEIDKNASPFDDEGSFGGNQGSLFYNRSGFTLFGWRIFYDKDLYKFIKSYPEYKDYSVDDMYVLYKNINNEGCGFVSMANMIFQQYEGKEDEFEETFGFPMYDEKTKDLNFDRLIIDIYTYTNDKVFLNQPNGENILVNDVLNYYEDKPEKFKKKYGIDYDESAVKLRQTIVDYYAGKDVVKIKSTGNTTYSYENRLMAYAEYRGIKCTDSVEYNLTTDEIEKKLKKGYSITVGCVDFDLYDKNKELYAEDIGGHYMTVTGVTEDGYIEVSSWGEKYYIKSDDPGIDDFQIVKIK